jgi:Tfp pilus assembly protein PilV
MKKNILATSIIEAMVVLLVVLIAITGAYDMISNAIRVTDGSEQKLIAISMAKE